MYFLLLITSCISTVGAVFLMFRFYDEAKARAQIESDAEYTRNLQIRVINQLREELASLERITRELREEKTTLNTQNTDQIQNKILFTTPHFEPAIDVFESRNITPKGVSSLKVVSVINYKGGVGKTTVTSNIATHVAACGKRVLMIDLDPQTNLTLSFLNNTEWEENYANDKTLKDFFQPILEGAGATMPLESLIINLDVQGVKMDLISSHLELINVDTELAACLGGGSESLLRRNFLSVHNHLRQGIKALESRYDLILIDCPPSFNTVVKNALTASDFYLVPAKMDYLSTLGIEQLRRNSHLYVEKHNKTVDHVGKAFSKISPSILGVIPTMLSLWGGAPISANQHYISQLESKDYYLFPWLRENTNLYAPAPNNGIPVILAHGASAVASGIIDELKTLSNKFIEKVGI